MPRLWILSDLHMEAVRHRQMDALTISLVDEICRTDRASGSLAWLPILCIGVPASTCSVGWDDGAAGRLQVGQRQEHKAGLVKRLEAMT